MIRFYFDTNVFSHLMDSNNQKCLKLALERQVKSEIMISFTVINCHELLVRFNEMTFQNAREEIRKTGKIVGGGNVLEDPWIHVQRHVNSYLGLPAPSLSIDWVTIPKMLSNSGSWAQLEKEQWFVTSKLYVENYKKQWAGSMGLVKQQILTDLKNVTPNVRRKKLRSILLDGSHGSLLRSKIWDAYIKRYRLSEQAKQINVESAYEIFPAIRYAMDAYLAYLKKLFINEEQKPVGGDYFDLEQVIYLDIMDFFVSDDKPLLDTLSTSLNEDFKKRCISLEGFCEMLRGQLPEPCAPNPIKMIKYGFEKNGVSLDV
jgi:hypothetical protein